MVSRILQAVPVLLVVGFIAFALSAFVGDPVLMHLGQDQTQEQREALIRQLGRDRPIFVRYADYLWGVLHGDFGISYAAREPVGQLLMQYLPATLELAGLASALAVAVGVPMGVYTAIHRNTLLSRVFMIGSLIGVSLPTFMLGMLLILVFSVWLGWLPSFGRETVLSPVLPAVTLAMFQMTMIMRLVRAEMLEILRAEYIRFARARGLADRAIHFSHALKNTLVPVMTIIALQFGGIVAFSLVTETVFEWPGLGRLLVKSVASADGPVMSAYLLLTALLFVTINLVVDLLYFAIDPRLRLPRGGA